MLTRLRRHAEQRDQAGFTLIELVLTVALLGVIGAAIVSSFLVMLTTKESTTEQLDASADQQFLVSFFTDDVAGAREVLVGGTQTICGTSSSPLVTFAGSDFAPGTTTAVPVRTAWVYRPPVSPSTVGQVERLRCVGSTLTRSTLARDVSAAPTLTGGSSCTSAITATKPTYVQLSVTSTFGTTAEPCGRRRVA